MTHASDTSAVILVAAGRGTRAGAGLPKQWRPLAGRRVADWTISAFRNAGLSPIVVVVHPDDIAIPLPSDVIRVTGGEDRSASVRAGLEALADAAPATVLIHDIARPCVSGTLIDRVTSALSAGALAVAPGVEVIDALWTGSKGKVIGVQPRDGLFRAQTPQGFALSAILSAHRDHTGPAAVDVEVARAAGIPVTIVAGDADNLKITRPEDFARAERILTAAPDLSRLPAVRLGNGYDVHRFCPGNHVILCGVEVPHDHALDGHSDADVGLHAITDAIYGALAEGDIGRHFPPSDPQWKGADSAIFLEHAGQLARAKGYGIGNIDCTLVCERPKIGPHAEAMQATVARILDIEADLVSVKATTSERLGFTGRGEGIAALATASLIRN